MTRQEKLVALRACEHCVHYWERVEGKERKKLPPACGKGSVSQFDLIKARSEYGDCGPSGKYYMLNPRYNEEKAHG